MSLQFLGWDCGNWCCSHLEVQHWWRSPTMAQRKPQFKWWCCNALFVDSRCFRICPRLIDHKPPMKPPMYLVVFCPLPMKHLEPNTQTRWMMYYVDALISSTESYFAFTIPGETTRPSQTLKRSIVGFCKQQWTKAKPPPFVSPLASRHLVAHFLTPPCLLHF